MELNEILQVALKGGASDIHLKAGLPPMFRVDGSLVPLKDGRRLPPEEIARMAFGIMSDHQKDRFKGTNEVDLAYGVPGLGRFRVNVFQQRGTIGAVLRVIPFRIQSIEQLMLPKVLEKIAMEERGLILVTGTTGSGKSTTLAAMIDHINASDTCHIMTIEDPIEFLIRDKRSVVNQREVGVDTMSFAQALKSALRQDPDVILVGEMRDLETIETALTAAETGHLVMSTLHTLDASETINRVISVFPPYQQKQVRLQLGSTLKAVVSQRLVPRADGRGRVAAVEVLIATARVREMIEDKDRTKEITDALAQGHQTYGMQTFDQSLMSLLKQQLITYEEALRQATNRDDFALRVSGVSATSDSKWDDFEGRAGSPAHHAPAVGGPPPPARQRRRASNSAGHSRQPSEKGRRLSDRTFLIRKARPPPAFQEAIRLLRITDRSRAALTERLAGRGCDEREIGTALERLTALGYVDDQRLALAKAKSLLDQGKGPALIAARLEQLGIPPTLVQKTVAGLSLDERGLIERALAEQLGSGFSPAELRRVGRRLITRGFSPDLVESAVAERMPEGIE